MSWPVEWCIANAWNGLTPDGQTWKINYDKGFIHFSGILKTRGTWSQIQVGTNPCQYFTVGQQASFRQGGHINQKGEYIQSNCNSYTFSNNSVTSKINWEDTRVFWYLFELPE